MSEVQVTNYTRGYVVLYEEGCESWILLPAENLWDPYVRATLYLFGLFWCFAGIAIAADIFMAAIEVITSQERTITRNGEVIRVKIWNGTVANLSLMALGCSAPEILLALIETIMTLGKPAGELGSGAIVGSAAYNLLIVTAVCILSVPVGQSRRLGRFGVFMITTFFSVLAYLWLYIVLVVMTPNEVTLMEAMVTLMLFPLLVIVSYCQDVNWFRQVTNEKDLESNVLEMTVDTTEGEHYEANRAEIASLIRSIKALDFEEQSEPEDNNNSNKFRKSTEDLMYRMTAIQGIAGRRRTLAVRMNTFAEDTYNNESSSDEEEMMDLCGIFLFAAPTYSVKSTGGAVTVKVMRTGMFKGTATVDYYTEDGSAEKGKHYIETSGRLTFGEGENSKSFSLTILDDLRENVLFYVVLRNPSEGAIIKEGKGRTAITVIDSDEQSVIQFEKQNYKVMESGKFVELTIIREHGEDGICSVEYETEDGTARIKYDYVDTKGSITFDNGETSKTITIPIIDDDIPEDDLSFYVHLKNPSKNSLLGKRSTATVTIVDDDRANFVVEKVADIMKSKVFMIDTKSWKQQFINAMMLSGEMDEQGGPVPPSVTNMFFHCVTFPWKVLFAFLPPPELMNGWPAFFAGLFAIGCVTSVVAQLAKLFGCIIGLKDTITAISFVAVGTSLPDTFASKQAAQESETADTSIGNVTGSNSVNVYLGLGLPWTVAALYYSSKGERYIVQADDLGFSVAVFLVCAVFCISLLLFRRYYPEIGGELGGHKGWKYICSLMLGGAWFLYLLLSGLRAYNHI